MVSDLTTESRAETKLVRISCLTDTWGTRISTREFVRTASHPVFPICAILSQARGVHLLKVTKITIVSVSTNKKHFKEYGVFVCVYISIFIASQLHNKKQKQRVLPKAATQIIRLQINIGYCFSKQERDITFYAT